ncbi:WW domain-binding protein 11-like [Rhopilema esculentum]|uniref:WW domain-binding protein 11-like n=1 Tax=Rhopilema esculentum TaxID=499914 RepID=UPI0031D09367
MAEAMLGKTDEVTTVKKAIDAVKKAIDEAFSEEEDNIPLLEQSKRVPRSRKAKRQSPFCDETAPKNKAVSDILMSIQERIAEFNRIKALLKPSFPQARLIRVPDQVLSEALNQVENTTDSGITDGESASAASEPEPEPNAAPELPQIPETPPTPLACPPATPPISEPVQMVPEPIPEAASTPQPAPQPSNTQE